MTAKAWLRRRLDRTTSVLARPLGPLVDELVYRRPFVNGNRRRLHLGRHVSTMNTLFNVSSGDITVGDRTIFGHNCMVLTGRHEFEQGRLRPGADVPATGYDITIGADCWIASGAMILGGVTLGDSVIVAAGAVVVHDVPGGSTVAGVPARIIRSTQDASLGDEPPDRDATAAT